MRRHARRAWEVAADRSAEAVGRGEKTLEEHELYVGGLLAGDISPPRQRNGRRAMAAALGAIAAIAAVGIGALVTGAVTGDAERPRPPAAPSPPPPTSSEEPTVEELPPPYPKAEDPSAPSTATRLEAALKNARQRYLDLALVARPRKLKPDVIGGKCLRDGPGVYRCETSEERDAPPLPPEVRRKLPSPPPYKEQWSVAFKVRLYSTSCWKAALLDPNQSTGTGPSPVDLGPLKGCLRN